MVEAANSGAKLRKSIVCPNCWRSFPPMQVRFVAEGPRLVGDPVAGPMEQLRFRAMRFDAAGNALDPHGNRCSRIACPHCHLEMPRALLALRQLPISVVGAPGSGKTSLLAAGMWGLAQRAGEFGLRVVDADPAFNTIIHRNENALFASADPAADVTIPKTDVAGAELYRSVRIGGNEEMVPKPAYFVVTSEASRRRSMMVLYDNAGEHFTPGTGDRAFASSTRHLERSGCIVIVFDPLQDLGFRSAFAADVDAPHATGHQRQELVFTEAISKVRQLRALDPTEPVSIPIVVAMTKADIWADAALGTDWWRHPVAHNPAERADGLLDSLGTTSDRLRTVIGRTAPEFVNAIAALAENAWFIPTSALGTSPARGVDGQFRLRAASIRPRWADMPFALAVHLSEKSAKKPEEQGTTGG